MPPWETTPSFFGHLRGFSRRSFLVLRVQGHRSRRKTNCTASTVNENSIIKAFPPAVIKITFYFDSPSRRTSIKQPLRDSMPLNDWAQLHSQGQHGACHV